MKLADVQKLVADGHHLVVVEYRASIGEVIKWRDKVTRQALSAPTLRHTVEFVGGSVSVSERVEEGFDTTKYVSPLKKGQKAVLKVTSWASNKGAITASGTLEPLE